MVSRRRLLHGSATALAALTAGCATLGQSTPNTEIGDVRAENYLPEPVDVQVLLTDGGDPAYWQSRTLPAASDDDRTTRDFTGLPAVPGNYTLYARTTAYSEDDWETVDVADVGTSCRAFILAVGDGADADADFVEILSSSNENHCDGWN